MKSVMINGGKEVGIGKVWWKVEGDGGMIVRGIGNKKKTRI